MIDANRAHALADLVVAHDALKDDPLARAMRASFARVVEKMKQAQAIRREAERDRQKCLALVDLLYEAHGNALAQEITDHIARTKKDRG